MFFSIICTSLLFASLGPIYVLARVLGDLCRLRPPMQRVQTGDHIIEVNGIRNDRKSMVEGLRGGDLANGG